MISVKAISCHLLADGADSRSVTLASFWKKTAAVCLTALICTTPALPTAESAEITFGNAEVTSEGSPVTQSGYGACGFLLAADGPGPQVAMMLPAGSFTACVRDAESVEVSIPIEGVSGTFSVSCLVDLLDGKHGKATISIGEHTSSQAVGPGKTLKLEAEGTGSGGKLTLRLGSGGSLGETAVRWRELRVIVNGAAVAIPLLSDWQKKPAQPLLCHPELRPAAERVLVEWDWRLQDGIGTPREAADYSSAITLTLDRGDRLIQDLLAHGLLPASEKTSWDALRSERQKLADDPNTPPVTWEGLWRRVHLARRRIVFKNPLAKPGPLVFAKHAPGGLFSHQLTQYYGANQLPGGGLYVLEKPGHSMGARPLVTKELPQGAYMQPHVYYDGSKVLFAYCEVPSRPPNRGHFWRERFFHLYEVGADGKNLKKLTNESYDDIAPCYLPNGKIIFTSTRRGGFHRCGAGPCPIYTLALCDSEGRNPRTSSWHETHDWDPAVLNDGRVVYTRWDYVDRNAIHYQQLWTVQPDGSRVSIFYGNNTLNPIGIWEARAIPGSTRIMATAGAHHAMTAGSIILVDTAKGRDGLEPLTRLTPDVLFPESEARVGNWHAPVGVSNRPPVSVEEKRWPGHCYRSPYPLSERFFLAAYSFEPLIGEPSPNKPNMFGLYMVDCFGNKELLYRDLNISSVWPVPLAKRSRPPALPSLLADTATDKVEGMVFLQNVYESWTKLPEERITRLRIIQVLPKTTPNINQPRVGLANASPGKQVLGTVPVEEDGSAFFRVPANIPIQFQAVDDRGMAIQTMRSLICLQPGEKLSCVGCHEHAAVAPNSKAPSQALLRAPSVIAPAPDGSKPFSYPLLVQPVLERQCVSCHNAEVPGTERGNVILTGEPENHFSVSYNVLVKQVPFPQWGGNPKPRTYPGQYGARASPLMKKLLKGHEDVKLSADDIDRLATWMDVNALFYGTFNPKDQQRQLGGEIIEGPDLE